MSGHSKWSQIKRQKGSLDAKRGQLFTKLGREIAVAAREGAEPAGNPRLRLAIQRGRDANMPMDTIERAVKRGAGAGEDASYQEVSYEGYGPNGVAILVAALTDNRNRAAAEIRSAFQRSGGNLGESGSVRWLFDEKGVIVIEPNGVDSDELALTAIDAGAEDVLTEEGSVEVFTDRGLLEDVRTRLEQKGIPVASSEVTFVPKMTVPLDADSAQQTMRLIERLEELDDVQAVYSNSDVSDEVAASLAG